ncbi:unnamed protein product, partial [Protopolystoma xenopodis]
HYLCSIEKITESSNSLDISPVGEAHPGSLGAPPAALAAAAMVRAVAGETVTQPFSLNERYSCTTAIPEDQMDVHQQRQQRQPHPHLAESAFALPNVYSSSGLIGTYYDGHVRISNLASGERQKHGEHGLGGKKLH